ncbi:MAG: hypothetical protein Q9226_005419 [Calogaya cf. arnoldii]
MPTPQYFSEAYETQADSPAPVESGLYSCGSAYYAPEQYICYGNFLCPIVEDEPSLQCGDACYLESLYTCDQGVLVSLDEGRGADSDEPATATETEPSGDDSSASTSTSGADEAASSDVGFAMDGTSSEDLSDKTNKLFGDDDSYSAS